MRVLRLFSILGVAACATALTAAEPQARVRVHVTDAFGGSITAPHINVSSVSGRFEVKLDEPINLPYGFYTVSVSVPGFESANIPARIDQPDQVIVVGLKLGAYDAPVPVCSILGNVTPASGVTRLRLVQMFGTYLADVAVGEGGLFQFTSLECGDYMIIMVGEGRCLGTKTTRAQMSPQRLALKPTLTADSPCTSSER